MSKIKTPIKPVFVAFMLGFIVGGAFIASPAIGLVLIVTFLVIIKAMLL